MPHEVGRFAPSTTGPAHPGTLLAALLCWLDARSRRAHLVLRLEDLDPQRCRPEWSAALPRDLAWLGLDWDAFEEQHDNSARHGAALDQLAAAGALYPCACSRATLRDRGERGPDGGYVYPNTCRARRLPAGGWRECDEPLRAWLPDGPLALCDESGLDLSQDPAAELGDPVVRRRDGAISYLIASVVDDAAWGVTRVVRGRDLAATTATQARIHERLGLATPVYRHHLLLREEAGGGKLAKFHGAVALDALRPRYDAEALCGVLAQAAGLATDPAPTTPAALLSDFGWPRVAAADRVLRVESAAAGEGPVLTVGDPVGDAAGAPPL